MRHAVCRCDGLPIGFAQKQIIDAADDERTVMMLETDALIFECLDTDRAKIRLQLFGVAAKIIVVAEAKPRAERRRREHCERGKTRRSVADMAGDEITGNDNQIGSCLHQAFNDDSECLRLKKDTRMNVGDEKEPQRRETARPADRG